MRIVQRDLVNGSYVEVSEDGIVAVRRHMIDEVSGPMTNALGCPGLEVVGQLHPTLAGASVRRIRLAPSPNDTDMVFADVVYETPRAAGTSGGVGKYVVRYGSSVTQEQTQIDLAGDPIQAHMPVKLDDGTFETVKKTATAPVLLPRRTIEAQGIFQEKPKAEVFAAVGTTNARDWQDGKPKTWLCLGVDVESRDNGRTFNVVARWMHDERTWDTYCWHVSEDGKPSSQIDSIAVKAALASDPTPSDPQKRFAGVTRVCVYKQSDFFALFGF